MSMSERVIELGLSPLAVDVSKLTGKSSFYYGSPPVMNFSKMHKSSHFLDKPQLLVMEESHDYCTPLSACIPCSRVAEQKFVTQVEIVNFVTLRATMTKNTLSV